MCGIVGYIGKRQAAPILLEGIKQLEYRGYDSSGLATISDGRIYYQKSAGKIAQLEAKLADRNMPGNIGIVHTRWATHGQPTEINAHPHFDNLGDIAVVHNGIIENYDILKSDLEKKGHIFQSDTDTEVIPHLIHYYLKNGNIEKAVRKALKKLVGTYGLAILCRTQPEKLVVARKGSPVVIGVGDGENFVASDVNAFLEHTHRIIYLDDNEMAVLSCDKITTTTIDNVSVNKCIEAVDWDPEMVKKDGYAHYMLKEIFEQPQALTNALRGRLDESTWQAHLGGLSELEDRIKRVRRIILSGCGTSYHAALIGEHMIEDFTRIPVEVEYASEFRYRNPVIDASTLFVAVSQSGETADTLAATKEAKLRGATVIGICNVVGSSIAREAHGGIYLHAGPEIGVASTKAFTSQLVVLWLLTLFAGRMRSLSMPTGSKLISALKALPEKVEQTLRVNEKVLELAQKFKDRTNCIYLGRGYNYPIALEGALKLKEISYIHAEGYPAAEMKHGPIALIDENMPVVFIATRDSAYEKIMGNIEEVKTRKGIVIAIATEGDKTIASKVDHVLYIPEIFEPLTPVLSVIPLQLFAYHIAALRNCNIDKPRNLAKSVTVE